MFSLVKVDTIPFGGEVVKNRVFVDFHLDLIHPLGELFFSSFTFDIVKLRESAKTSILQKIVEVCLHN